MKIVRAKIAQYLSRRYLRYSDRRTMTVLAVLLVVGLAAGACNTGPFGPPPTTTTTTTPLLKQTPLTFITTPANPIVVGDVYIVEVVGGDSQIPITLTNQGVDCVITDVTQSLFFTSSPPDPAVVGNTYTPTATDGAYATVTFKAEGACNINANQPADATYKAAPTVKQTVTVTQ